MILLGIDPGTRRMGYGVVEYTNSAWRYVRAGVFPTYGDDLEVTHQLQTALFSLLKETRPDVVGVEKIFFSKNQKTAMAVAQARGVVIAEIARVSTTLIELSPSQIKLCVAGSGNAPKSAVSKMVCLTLKTPKLDLIDDAMDALATAIAAGVYKNRLLK